MTRAEKAAIFGLLLVDRGFSLAALADAKSRGNERQAARTRRHIEKADEAITILEAELTSTQAN